MGSVAARHSAKRNFTIAVAEPGRHHTLQRTQGTYQETLKDAARSVRQTAFQTFKDVNIHTFWASLLVHFLKSGFIKLDNMRNIKACYI